MRNALSTIEVVDLTALVAPLMEETRTIKRVGRGFPLPTSSCKNTWLHHSIERIKCEFSFT